MSDLFRKAPATLLLIAANLLVFLVMLADAPRGEWDVEFLVDWGANYGPLTFGGQWWRLFTAMFLHANFAHVAGNMTALVVWGAITESLLGTARMAPVYLASGLAASFASASIHPDAVSVGASGAIAGLLGVMTVMWLKGGYGVTAQMVLANLLLNAFISFAAAVDWAAHLGGLVAGLVLGVWACSGPRRQGTA